MSKKKIHIQVIFLSSLLLISLAKVDKEATSKDTDCASEMPVVETYTITSENIPKEEALAWLSNGLSSSGMSWEV